MKREVSQDGKDLYNSRIDLPYKKSQHEPVNDFSVDNSHMEQRVHDRSVL
jgi:hypothetical protein